MTIVPSIESTTDGHGVALRFHRGVGFLLCYTNAYGGRVAFSHSTSKAGARRGLKAASPMFRDLMAPWYVVPCIGADWWVSVTYRGGHFEDACTFRHNEAGGTSFADIPEAAYTLLDIETAP